MSHAKFKSRPLSCLRCLWSSTCLQILHDGHRPPATKRVRYLGHVQNHLNGLLSEIHQWIVREEITRLRVSPSVRAGILLLHDSGPLSVESGCLPGSFLGLRGHDEVVTILKGMPREIHQERVLSHQSSIKGVVKDNL